MFSGIVEERGAVREIGPSRLAVSCRTVLEGTEVGSSIAVNGVCLTVVERGDATLAFDLSEETLRRTGLARLSTGDPVNLERPVTLATRLGGHLVQGHVDGVGEVVGIRPDGLGGVWLTIRPPEYLVRYLVEKGSVSVDGISLTVAGLDDGTFSVALIPHTLNVTTMRAAKVGEPVNLEVDLIAKYVERLVAGHGAERPAGGNERDHGAERRGGGHGQSHGAERRGGGHGQSHGAERRGGGHGQSHGASEGAGR